ncbi:MAG: hypothetical protein ABI665_29300 [Vicinamibacterales bacterium]
MSDTTRVTEDDRKAMASYIAMVVRNTLEHFHREHLNDDQMRQLNPLIRNAIYTAMYAASEVSSGDPAAAVFMKFNVGLIPDYWEAPTLLDEYILFKRLRSPLTEGGN